VVPVRADGLQLLGKLSGSGYRRPPALVRRVDGQVVQLTPLLYQVLDAADGTRTYEEIGAVVGPQVRRTVTARDVHVLSERLRALGLLRRVDGTEPELRRSNPLLALRWRYVVSDPVVTNRLTGPFAVLFAPVVVALVCAGFLAVCVWLLLHKGLGSATHQAFDQPALLLAIFLLIVVSAGFHEFGHAAAARYGGARPGAMGAGLYLIWPAFYTDVTDSYRLGRAGRVRTDLGGLYFNAMVAVVMFGAWWATGWDALLLVIATQVLQMLRQLPPLVRFDGYHLLADLTGVPDLFQRIRPTLLGLLPGRWRDPRARDLKPWARAVVTAWVLVVVPLLLTALVLMALAVPRLLGTAAAGLTQQASLLGEAFRAGDLAGAGARLLAVGAIALPVLGTVYILARTARQLAVRTWRSTADRPRRRTLAVVAALGMVGGLAAAWWPQPGAYRPVQAYERGALQDAVPASWQLPAAGIVAGRGGQTQTLWPAEAALPGPEAPALAVVLVPRTAAGPNTTSSGTGSTTGQSDAGSPATAPAPTWVFPFDRPLPAGEGDNQAVAVNTTDGSTVYDVAFALVWADGDTVLNTNEAYALASCTDCRTVAISFQVVLVLGQADGLAPQNLAAAVNYACVECVTYALATQLVLTVDEPLDDASAARLQELWEEIAAFGAAIEDVPLSQIQARLSAYEDQLVEILQSAGDGGTDTAVTGPESTTPGVEKSLTPSPETGTESTTTDRPTGATATPAEPAPTGTTTPSVEPTTTPSASPSATTGPTASPTPSPDPTPSPSASPTVDPSTDTAVSPVPEPTTAGP